MGAHLPKIDKWRKVAGMRHAGGDIQPLSSRNSDMAVWDIWTTLEEVLMQSVVMPLVTNAMARVTCIWSHSLACSNANSDLKYFRRTGIPHTAQSYLALLPGNRTNRNKTRHTLTAF